jgi:hypothetical protein
MQVTTNLASIRPVRRVRFFGTAAVPLSFVIVLAVAPETRAQVSISFSNLSVPQAERVMEFQRMRSGPFYPASNQMIDGPCGTGPVSILITNGSASPLRYLMNAGDCAVTLQCYSGGCTGTATGSALTLLAKPAQPFRAFGIACPATADTICVTPIGSGVTGEWRLQAVYPQLGGP